MPSLDLDLTGVVDRFVRERAPERTDLMRLFDSELNHNPKVKMLLAEIGQACANEGLPPLACMGKSMIYGMVLGIFMEQDRAKRRRARN